MNKLTTAFVLLLLSCPALRAAAAIGQPFGFAAAGEAAGRSSAYRVAQELLEEERWAQAAAAFAAITETGGAEADAALYWRGYAEHRGGRSVEALEALRRLAAEFPESAWRDDARALEAEIRGVSAEAGGDDELKLYALNSLVHTNPERAIPILERFLAGDHSTELRERALFVLAQSGSPRASEILRDAALRDPDPELRRKAVEYLGVFGGRETAELLAQIYATSADPELKEKILESFMVSGQQAQLLAIAQQETDPELREKAIEMLAISGAVEPLRELYARERDVEVREKILESTVVSGDTELLRIVLASETDPEVQEKAVELMGVHGNREARAELVGLYRRTASRDLKERVIEALMVAGDADALVEIVRSESDPELKREALEKLSMLDSDEAARFFEEILED